MAQQLGAAILDRAGKIVVTGSLEGDALLGDTLVHGPDAGASALVARLELDGGVISTAIGTAGSSGSALQAAAGTSVVLGGVIGYGAFQLGDEGGDAGARGVVLQFAP